MDQFRANLVVAQLHHPLPRLKVEPEEVIDWLEWAGAKLIAMPGRRIKPSEAAAFWVDFVQDVWTPDEFQQKLQVRAMAPSASEITLMDLILPISALCDDIMTRRIINARSLVHPVNRRNLYPWLRIAKLLNSDRRTVRRHHHQGIIEITKKIEPSIVLTIRQHPVFT